MVTNSSERTCAPMRRARRVALALAAGVLAVGPAAGQDPKGVAIAEAPERGYFACFGENEDDTLACALERCGEEGGEPCLRTRWCYPAGWSGAMAYVANGKVPQLTFVCGAPSDEAVKTMLSVWCAASPWSSDCVLTSLWDPLGNEVGREALLGKNPVATE